MEIEGCNNMSEVTGQLISQDEDIATTIESTVIGEESINFLKDNEINVKNKQVEVEAVDKKKEVEIDSNIMEEECFDYQCDNTYNSSDEMKATNDVAKVEDVFGESSFITNNSFGSSEPTTSQDNIPTSSNDDSDLSPSDQSKTKRSISKGQINGDSDISVEKSGHSSDEDSSKRLKLTENICNNSKTEADNLSESTSKFHKLKSKVKKRNYRSKKGSAGDTGDICNETGGDDSEIRPETCDTATTRGPENHEEVIDVNSDGPDSDDGGEDDSDEWTTDSDDKMLDKTEEDIPACLKKEKPKPNWFIIPALLKRETGCNPLFRRKYYGSLHVVERFELMYSLNKHQGCVNALNFNKRGNLLASGSDDLAVVVWDWTVGKQHHYFDSGHRSNVFQTKWLPLDVEYLMVTCARDGQVRLLDIVRGISRNIATHNASTHKLAVHPDSPHVVISAGEDAKVFSIDIRDDKPTKLLVVKEDSYNVKLYSVHSNPLNSNEFCVAGRSETVRIYDRRKVSPPLYKLCPNHLINSEEVHITCAVYNYNGTEVLASYNDEDIYLFDTVLPQTGDFAHKYQGHRNSATVKGVNFFGPKSEFVVSGSDCGNIFIWDKNTEAIVNWMAGDQQGVVNCVEPHPHIPVLATSGLDFDVKIWVPSRERSPTMKNLETCVKSNATDRVLGTTPNTLADDMLWILLRHLPHTERARVDLNVHRDSRDRNRGNNENDDDDADDLTDDIDSSDHSDSQSEGESVTRIQCPPS